MVAIDRVGYSVTMLTGDFKNPYSIHGWGDIPKSPVAIPAKVGRGEFEISTVRPGMVISRATHEISSCESGRSLELARNEVLLSEPAIIVQALAKGKLVHTDEGICRTEFYDVENTLVQWGDCFSFRRKHEVGAGNELYSLMLTEMMLRELLGDRLAKRLLSELKLGREPSLSVLKLPPFVMSALNYSLYPGVSTEFQKVFASAKVLEYATLVADFVLGRTEAPISPQRSRMARQVRDELCFLQGMVPAIDVLAKKYGVSAHTLAAYFRKEYDESIFSFHKKLRLTHAHELILNTGLPLKVIAAKAGYEHVSNFASAFKNMFGYPPGRIRE